MGQLNMKKQVCKGLVVKKASDGHWMCFESNGKHAMICIENLTFRIVRSAIVDWIDEQFNTELK